MKTGLIGLPLTGKTTFFNLLTDAKDISSSGAKSQLNIKTAKVPDNRIDYLSGIFQPKKTTYASIEVIDIQGIVPGGSSYHFLEAIRKVDALVHVVRVFEDDSVVHYSPDTDPVRDIEIINTELLFADLSVIENRIERILTGKKVTKENSEQLEVLKKCKECLESEKPISNLDLSDSERDLIKSFDFLTERPMILLINLDENQLKQGEYKGKEQIESLARKMNLPLLEVCAKTEFEISQLDSEDKQLFMEDLGITDTGLEKLARTMYDLLGLISFITVGTDEVRAWPVKQGISAKAAGGKIHSDIERGFIRAEIIKYSDFSALGSMQKIKEKGLMKLEGKDAIIEDGDIVNFRFNV